MHVLFFTEDFPEADRGAGGLRVSVRKQAEGLAESCRVTVVVYQRVFPPLRRYADSKIIDQVGVEAGAAPPDSLLASPPVPDSLSGGSDGRRRPHVLRYSYLHLPIIWPITEPLQITAIGLWALLRHARDADILHGHCLYAMGVPALLLGKLLNRPSVSTTYGTDLYELAVKKPGLARWWARAVLRGATRVIAVSQSLLQLVADLGAGSGRRRLVPSGVDLDRFRISADKTAIRRRLGLPIEAHIFLSVNMFWHVKGHAVLVEAFRRLAALRPESHLIMTADGPLRSDITAQVRDAGLNNRVLFTGLLNLNDVPLWIAAADTLVLPSLNEGMPLAVLEAFASGKPVVGTNVGGIPELITDRSLGILVAPGDPAAFAAAMAAAMDQSWDQDLLRARAAEFSWPSVIEKLLAVYQEVAAGTVSSRTKTPIQ